MTNINTGDSSSNSQLQIDIRVVFDIYGEEGDEIVRYALGAFCNEASKYLAQLYLAVSQSDEDEANRLFHSLKTMSAMIGARQFSKVCAELELMSLQSDGFSQKYAEFQQLWPLILKELEHHLG